MLSNYQLEIVLGIVAQKINSDTTFPRKLVEVKMAVYDKSRRMGLSEIRQDFPFAYPEKEITKDMPKLQNIAEKIILLLSGDENDPKVKEFKAVGEILCLLREEVEKGS